MVEWTPEFRKAYQKAYRQTPEAKACKKAYMKAYNQTPEYKAYQKAYQKAYIQRKNDKIPAEIKYQKIIAKLRKKYELICLTNPELAKKIKEDMEQEEGMPFRELAIDGIYEKQAITTK